MSNYVFNIQFVDLFHILSYPPLSPRTSSPPSLALISCLISPHLMFHHLIFCLTSPHLLSHSPASPVSSCLISCLISCLTSCLIKSAIVVFSFPCWPNSGQKSLILLEGKGVRKDTFTFMFSFQVKKWKATFVSHSVQLELLDDMVVLQI